MVHDNPGRKHQPLPCTTRRATQNAPPKNSVGVDGTDAGSGGVRGEIERERDRGRGGRERRSRGEQNRAGRYPKDAVRRNL